MVITFIFGNLKDCLMETLQLLVQVIITSIPNQGILVIKQDKITYTDEKIVNIYIVYEISKTYIISSYPILGHYLFVQLVLLTMPILISIIILDMELNLTGIDFVHILVVELVEM